MLNPAEVRVRCRDGDGTGTGWDGTGAERVLGCYLGMQAHPAAVEGVFAEAGGAAHVVLPRGGVDDLQGLVAHRPVHAEVGGLARLARLRIADAWGREGAVREWSDTPEVRQQSEDG